MAEAESEPVRLEGDRLSELYRWYADDAVRLAYLITGDRSLAEDLVQDAFVRLAGRVVHLRGSSKPFEAYLRRTVVNLANSHFRRRKIERRYQERQSSMLTTTSHDPDIPSRETAREALLRLSPRQRTALVLRFYVDLSEAQTAEVMGCRRGTVKALVSQGLGRLRMQMAGD
ncbi:MAG TPA: SigE family RNA polymerase sigma factor [Actinomycetota bacterium]|nr:SigE family RNA polymerase sigma factor [Actinomycetota bacterium]